MVRSSLVSSPQLCSSCCLTIESAVHCSFSTNRVVFLIVSVSSDSWKAMASKRKCNKKVWSDEELLRILEEDSEDEVEYVEDEEDVRLDQTVQVGEPAQRGNETTDELQFDISSLPIVFEDADIVPSPTPGTSADFSVPPVRCPSPPSPLVVQTDESSESEEDDSTENGIWLTSRPNIQKIRFTGKRKLNITPTPTTPIEFFNIFFNNSFLELLVEKMNEYAVLVLLDSSTSEARIARWKDVTTEELKIFFGLLFHMGMIRMNRINDYWKTHYLFPQNIFAPYMSRNRFLLLLRVLNFDNNKEDDNLRKIRTLIEFFNSTMESVYDPGKELSLDESMVHWRGRLRFRQYIKNKRHKYGCKLYCLTSSKGLIQKLLLYQGSSDNEVGGVNHRSKVVHHLMSLRKNVGHSVYMDNYYNGVPLAEELLKEGIYCTGTLQSNRKGNPPEVVQKKLKRGESISRYTKSGVCITKWKDKRDVLALSSEFPGDMVEVGSKKKPQLIFEYNKFMSGVDRHDQLLSYYPSTHKTLRWYKKLGIHIFQMMLINAQLLCNEFGRKINGYDFRMAICEALLPYKPSPKKPLSCDMHVPDEVEKVDTGKRKVAKRKRCKQCYKNGIRKDSNYFCPDCPDKPGLCLKPCFKLFHLNLL